MLEYEVICNKETHRLVLDDEGVLRMLDHDANEEETSSILGDETSWCYKTLRGLESDPSSWIVSAAAMNNKPLLNIAIKMGGDPNSHQGQALVNAAQNGHTEVVRILLDNGADVTLRDHIALRKCVRYNRYETVKLLLENGDDIHSITTFTKDNLARGNYHEMLSLLLDKGLDINRVEESLLFIAAQYGHKKMVDTLLEKRSFTADEINGAIAAAEEVELEDGRSREYILDALSRYRQ